MRDRSDKIWGEPILYQFKIILGKTQKYILLGGELLLGTINLLQIKNLFIAIIWMR